MIHIQCWHKKKKNRFTDTHADENVRHEVVGSGILWESQLGGDSEEL